MNLKKVISACTASMLGLSYLCSAFTVAAAEKKDNLLVLGDASSKGYENSKTIEEIIEKNLDVNYKNLSDDAATTEDLLKKVKENVLVQAEIKNSDQVVISAGGYDYLKVIMNVVGEYTESGDSVEEVRQKMLNDSANASQKITEASKKTTDAINNITAVVKEIKEINPDTDVYIVSLYNPFKYDFEKYGVTNDPIIDAVSESVDSTLDTFNEQIADIDGVYKIMNTNNAFNRLARKYKNVTGDATGLSIKEQFDLATEILAEMTGETPGSALRKILSMIPANLLPLLPDNFTVKPMTFGLSEATYDLSKDTNHEVVIDLSLTDNFGISAFQGKLTIGSDEDKFTFAKPSSVDYKGSWTNSEKLGTIQFSADQGHNIDATDGVLGKIKVTIPENIKPGEYEVSLSESSISVLTTTGQKNYKQADDGIFKLAAGKIIIVDSAPITTTVVSTNATTTVSEPDQTGVTTTVSGPVQTGVTTTVSEPDQTGVTTTVSGPVQTGVTTTVSGPVQTGVTTTVSGPVQTGVTTVTSPVPTGVTTVTSPVPTGVTTTVSGTVTSVTTTKTTTAATTTTKTTTSATLPDISDTPKELKVPEGVEAQDMVSEVPLAQFYYSYDAEFNLEGLKVEAQTYDEKGVAEKDGKVDITKHIQLKDATATPKSAFDLANKKLIYNIPLEIKADKEENGKQYIYVVNENDSTKNVYYDVTALKKSFDGVTFKAYIGLRGDIDLNFASDTRDCTAVAFEYANIVLSKPSTLSKYTEKYITNNKLTLNADEKKALEQFTFFLGDSSVNTNSDQANGKYGIDTRDATYTSKYYATLTMNAATGKNTDPGYIWGLIDNPTASNK